MDYSTTLTQLTLRVSLRRMMAYIFLFDAAACTGCKSCQMACKDKHNLPVGVLWRRVFEVSGGSWLPHGEAWTNDVFAYYLSLGCNHCVHPKCAGVCPADAYVQTADGIVYIDETRCMGCGYCAWACPYGVPQYNPMLGRMTKCNFCIDELAQGKPPACVAACPMRVLNYAFIGNESSASNSEYLYLWEHAAQDHPFPLPAFSRTQPHLAIRPHPAMGNGQEKRVANREEVRPPWQVLHRVPEGQVSPFASSRSTGLAFFDKLHSIPARDELPLIAFTLLTQMAVGMTFFSFFFPLSLLHIFLIGFLLGAGGLVSFLHLGTKRNAWRAVLHLRKSWLSREILALGMLVSVWLYWFFERAVLKTGYGALFTTLVGLFFVYSMSQVYRLRAVPAWNSWRTAAAFFLSAGILGVVGASWGRALVSVWMVLWVLLALQVGLIVSAVRPVYPTEERLRGMVTVLMMLGVSLLPLLPPWAQETLSLPIVLLILVEQVWGRWLFYRMRVPAL
ncbi:MAG: hypothetical protein DDG60_07360 [Anaerolineae bacterium]|nr:MAG: hypothetical protein DDG60_07360 [Anaerolineae bacterium]